MKCNITLFETIAIRSHSLWIIYQPVLEILELIAHAYSFTYVTDEGGGGGLMPKVWPGPEVIKLKNVFCSVLCLLCLCGCLFMWALWSPAGKGLTPWLSFVVSNCEFVTFPLVSWVTCGTWLYRYLIFASLLTLRTVSNSSSQSLRFILSLRMNSCFITSSLGTLSTSLFYVLEQR